MIPWCWESYYADEEDYLDAKLEYSRLQDQEDWELEEDGCD